MTKQIYVIGLCLMALIFSSCNSKTRSDRTIVVSIEPQRYFAEQIAGDKFSIYSLLPEKVQPDNYQVTSEQLNEMAHCKAYFALGNLGFEATIAKQLQENNKNIPYFELSEGMAFENNDPNMWLSIRGAQTISYNLLVAFSQIDPANKEFYRMNYNKVQRDIDRISLELEGKMRTAKQQSFVIDYPVLTYYAQEFRLNQFPLTAIDAAKKYGTKTVFVQDSFSPEEGKRIAKELDAQLVTINPFAYDWSESMRRIATTLAD